MIVPSSILHHLVSIPCLNSIYLWIHLSLKHWIESIEDCSESQRSIIQRGDRGLLSISPFAGWGGVIRRHRSVTFVRKGFTFTHWFILLRRQRSPSKPLFYLMSNTLKGPCTRDHLGWTIWKNGKECGRMGGMHAVGMNGNHEVKGRGGRVDIVRFRCSPMSTRAPASDSTSSPLLPSTPRSSCKTVKGADLAITEG